MNYTMLGLLLKKMYFMLLLSKVRYYFMYYILTTVMCYIACYITFRKDSYQILVSTTMW